jgi:REP element-mobilizing transposase RayT
LTTYGRSRAVRLADCDYVGDIDVHVTICADHGEPSRVEEVARMVCENVELYCRKLAYRLYGFTLMPDHLHVLLNPAVSKSPLSRWLDLFKSFTTHEYMKMGYRGPLWQASAHDHVCRRGETAEKVVAYIAKNPVRAGLAERWQDWPWTRAFIAP